MTIHSAQLSGRIMKVNHAGEHSAISIYTGQIFMARLTARSLVPELIGFRADEEKHRAIFHLELQRRGLKRCNSYWLCAARGYALGAPTGLLGARAISLTTVAVERTMPMRLPRLPAYWPMDRRITIRQQGTAKRLACGGACSVPLFPA